MITGDVKSTIGELPCQTRIRHVIEPKMSAMPPEVVGKEDNPGDYKNKNSGAFFSYFHETAVELIYRRLWYAVLLVPANIGDREH